MEDITTQNTSMKITTLMENLNLLLDNTMVGSPIYTMTEKIKFFNLTQTQYQFLAFEHELFDILLKNKYAIKNDSVASEDGVTYANNDYPFSLIICSKDACRSSILINNTALVIIKFIMYLRMLNKYVSNPSSPNCFLAVNMKLLPFGRICVDVDYKMPVFGDNEPAGDAEASDEAYERFVQQCFHIVAEYTTMGDVIMTANCFTPNTRSFHLISEQQFDSATRDVLFTRIARRIKQLNDCVTIDQVHVWMLPFGRGHTPVRRFLRKKNETKPLEYPYTESDFELTMPFDLTAGVDNIFTLFDLTAQDDVDVDGESYDVLSEFLNDEIVHSYNMSRASELQLLIKVLSSKYDFAYRSSQYNMRFEHNYLPQVMANKYNNFFIIMSNKKLLFENNWHIPKPKIKQRPTEFYEIYRFIEHRLIGESLHSLEDLFALVPQKLISRNVNIGNVDEIVTTTDRNSVVPSTRNQCDINEVFTGTVDFNFTFHDMADVDVDLQDHIMPLSHMHPWPYLTENIMELTPIASASMRNTHEYFYKVITTNVYTYEKSSDNVMMYFRNIQSMLSKNTEDFAEIINKICKVMLGGDVQKLQKYIFPMYEFFCRVHYIDSAITMSEYRQIKESILRDTLHLKLLDTTLNAYRDQFHEMFVGRAAYRRFPTPNTPLDNIWATLLPEYKVVLHIIYLMIVEHNYTSIFMYMHNLFKTNNVTHMICSFMLNVIDNSYRDDEKDCIVYSYASREFLNFVYMTFINAGTNMQCNFDNGNISFNMVNLETFVSDLQLMFFASPMWFFLGNYQYIDENMDIMTRLDLFARIFQQGTINELSTGGDADTGSFSDGPPSKYSKRNPSLNHEAVFRKYNIPDMFFNDLVSIFVKYILAYCSTENGKYMYDGNYFNSLNLPETKIKPHNVRDPLKYATIYRHQYGIYNTWTMQMERHTSVLYTHISISNEEFAKYPEIFNAYNDDVYRILVNRFLKSIVFTRVLNYQKTLSLYMAPIYDPNTDARKLQQNLMHNIDSIQINVHDLASSDFVCNEEMFTDILTTRNKLYETFKWLYAIICHYSEHYSCKITTPGTFIPKCMQPELIVTNSSSSNNTDGGLESTYSLFQQQISESSYSMDSSVNRGENLIQRIHRILSAKKSDQQKNITDELHKLSQQELTSLIILFDNISNRDSANDEADLADDETVSSAESPETVVEVVGDVATAKKKSSKAPQQPIEEITKFNLSTRGGNTNMNTADFFGNDEYTDNSKIRLLLNLFNRKLNNEINQMPLENFQKIIEENFGHHITKFVLLILSWFIRTTHTHIFTDTVFFREIQQHRQTLYDQLASLLFKHHGPYILNESIVDITEIFSHYCRNVELVVDPVFEMSFVVDRDDLYLGYDTALEARVSRDIIHEIEAGCVSAIYQGQFIADTNVDLNRMWARVTVPRNKHRISPLFTLHTATGKSEYLAERCNRHFNNKLWNNYLDSSSLKTSDHRGVDMARELNANLIVCIEEFVDLKEKFKQICGHSAITYKPLWSDSKSSFQNNSTVILSTNNDPKCTEDAVIARLHVYPRRIQFATMNKYLKFQRMTICSTATMLSINNIMSVQLIMEKMPRTYAENYKGNFMMIWLLKRFFLYNLIDPVTVQTSETLQYHIDNFQNMINAPQLVLERLEPHKGVMTLFQFRKLVNRICEENRTLFNSKVDTYNVYTILSDKLKSLIDSDTQTIRVAEKTEKF